MCNRYINELKGTFGSQNGWEKGYADHPVSVVRPNAIRASCLLYLYLSSNTTLRPATFLHANPAVQCTF